MKENLRLILGSAFRGALGFGCGSVMIVLSVVIPILSAMGGKPLGGMLGLVMPAALMFGGGAIGGAFLRRSAATILGFGFGFVISGFNIHISGVAPQADGEFSWIPGFALAGLIGSLSLREGARVVVPSTVGFALCGLLGDWIFGRWVLNPRELSVAAIVLSVLVPYTLAGAIAGATMGWSETRETGDTR